jgi:glycosyltransferase involved in cell wall biosynthesis
MNDINDLPKLSVVMVVRNVAATIAHALDSIVAQHYPNLELIVWDGASTDGTQDIIARYKDYISIYKSEADSGSPDGCNKAVALATGDYVGFLYGDDEYEPGTLWAVADCIAKQPADVISFGMIYRTQGKVTGYYAAASQLELTLEKVLSDIPTFVLSRFYKRGVFGVLNTDRTLWYYANDRELMARLALSGCSNAIIPKALYGFNYHAEGLSSNPAHYTRIIEEHGLIAKALLARVDLTDAQRTIVQHWQKCQLVFGLWRALSHLEFDRAKAFLAMGIMLGGWRFVAMSLCLLTVKLVKRLGRLISGGIDRGSI